MKTEKEIKDLVKKRYSEIATQEKAVNAASCCGATNPSGEVYNIMADDYTKTVGYVAEADLGLGCGLPTHFAKIRKGNVVIDLGSGAGNDCFIARHETGSEGKVIGIDFSPAMISKARANAEKLGFNNVEFREGDIDSMPVSSNYADVVVSNCVLNLVPDKTRVMAEIFRVLKPGGHFSISDIVLVGELPESLKKDTEMYAGCVAGAIQKDQYMDAVLAAGFQNVEIQREKSIDIPVDILKNYLSDDAIRTFKSGATGIYSITVYGEKEKNSADKPAETDEASACCAPDSGCC